MAKKVWTPDDLVEFVVSQSQERWGPAGVQRASEALANPSEWASTGSFALDRAITGKLPGGIPIGPKRGRVVHIYSDWALGKSVLLDQIMKSVVKMGGLGYISETEGSRDKHFANAIGLDLTRVVIDYPANLAQLFDKGMDTIVKKWRGKDPDIPVLWGLDSLTLIESSRTYGVEMGGKKAGAFAFGGGKAAEIGDGCKKVAEECRTHRTSFVVINQVRTDPTVMFGRKKKPTGGSAVSFFASIELLLSPSQYGVIKDERGRVEARWVHATVVKNKIARSLGECDFLIHSDQGVKPWSGVFEALEDENLVWVKRGEKGKYGQKGKRLSDEFTVVATGEVLPLREFISWCESTKVLEKEVERKPGQVEAAQKSEDESEDE